MHTYVVSTLVHSFTNLEWIRLYFFKIRQDYQDYQDFFSSSISGHRPIGPMARREEIDETQSTFGGTKNSTQLFLFLFRHQKIVAT